MDLYPAIDLLGGRCVRLLQGNPDDVTVYDYDPVGRAERFAAAGARWIHVVDLDGALGTGRDNHDVVAAIASTVDVSVQTGGGLRDEASAEAALAAGCARVVLGTAAVADPGLVERLAGRHPGRVAAAVDAREGQVAVDGWRRAGDVTPEELAGRLAGLGVAALLATEVGRDGMLAGPDHAGLARLLARVDVPVLASGGVSCLEDLRVLARLEVAGRRLGGAVVGKAIYEDRFGVGEALAAIGGAPGRAGAGAA